MLARKYKFSVREFSGNSPTVFSGRWITVKAHKNDISHNRVNVVVGRGAIKKASQRNFVKRVALDVTKDKSGFFRDRNNSKDILIIIKSASGLDELWRKELIKELGEAVEKCN